MHPLKWYIPSEETRHWQLHMLKEGKVLSTGAASGGSLDPREVSLQNSAPPSESRPSGTESRVKKHMGSIFIKLGVETRNAATLRDLEALSQSRTKSA